MASYTVTPDITSTSEITGDFPSSISPGMDPMSTWKLVLLGITLCLVVLATITGNIIVIAAFILEKKLRTSFTMYIINLAITDFLVGVSAMTFYSFDSLLGYWPFGEVMCGIWIFFDYGMTFASVFTLVAISVDRYWSVCWSLHYRNYNTMKKTLLMLAIVWFLVFAIWLGPFILDRIRHSQPDICIWEPSENPEFVVVIAVIGHHTPCLIILFCYVKVALMMRTKARRVGILKNQGSQVQGQLSVKTTLPTGIEPSTTLTPISGAEQSYAQSGVYSCVENTLHDGTSVEQPGTSVAMDSTMPHSEPTKTARPKAKTGTSSYDKEQKVFMTLSYILFSYLFCWVPFHIIFDISAISPDMVPPDLYTFGFWLAYINSTINPIVYAYSNKDFRSAFKRILTCFYCKRNK